MKIRRLLLMVCILLTASASPAWSDSHHRIIRDAGLIATWPVHGVYLNMSPQAAFELLISTGFQAGNLTRFVDWEGEGIEFVRGEYGSSAGYVSLTMTRKGDRIMSIGETYNAPGSPIDAAAAIDGLKRHFSVTEVMRRCANNGAHNGICEVQDAPTGEVRHALTYQILTTMRIVTVRRRE